MANTPGKSKSMKPAITRAGSALRNFKNDAKSAVDGLSNIWIKPGSTNNSKRLKPK